VMSLRDLDRRLRRVAGGDGRIGKHATQVWERVAHTAAEVEDARDVMGRRSTGEMSSVLRVVVDPPGMNRRFSDRTSL
jgi:hypothetical protein